MSKIINIWYSINLFLLMFSLGVWGVSCIAMVVVYPEYITSWVLAINMIIFIIYAWREDEQNN